jgi:hypothetical protein
MLGNYDLCFKCGKKDVCELTKKGFICSDCYDEIVKEYEDEGMTRSDAQGIIDAYLNEV